MAMLNLNRSPYSEEGFLVRPEHFGLNYQFRYESHGDLPWDKFDEVLDFSGATSVRYPGGTGAEVAFDISNPNRTSYTLPDGSDKKTVPLDSFMDLMDTTDTASSIILPASMFLSNTMTGGHRNFAFEHEGVARTFIRNLLNDHGHQGIRTIEIGNEYEGYMSAVEYGRIAHELTLLVQEEFGAYQASGTAPSNWVEPQIAVQFWSHSVTGATSISELEVRNLNVLNQFTDESLDAVDAMVTHFYYRDGLSAGSENEHSFANIQNSIDQSMNLFDVWQEQTDKDLDLIVSEWNVNHNSSFGFGIQQAGMMLEMFTGFLKSGVDDLSFWSAQYQPTSLADAAGTPMVAGALFSHLVENTIGHAYIDSAEPSPGVKAYVFGNGETEVVYLINLSDGSFDVGPVTAPDRIDLSLAVSSSRLAVDRSAADGEFKGTTGLAWYEEPDLPVAWETLNISEELDPLTNSLTIAPNDVIFFQTDGFTSGGSLGASSEEPDGIETQRSEKTSSSLKIAEEHFSDYGIVGDQVMTDIFEFI